MAKEFVDGEGAAVFAAEDGLTARAVKVEAGRAAEEGDAGSLGGRPEPEGEPWQGRGGETHYRDSAGAGAARRECGGGTQAGALQEVAAELQAAGTGADVEPFGLRTVHQQRERGGEGVGVEVGHRIDDFVGRRDAEVGGVA